jgi:hypothetical protein
MFQTFFSLHPEINADQLRKDNKRMYRDTNMLILKNGSLRLKNNELTSQVASLREEVNRLREVFVYVDSEANKRPCPAGSRK